MPERVGNNVAAGGRTPVILATFGGKLGRVLRVIPSYLSAYMTDDTDDRADIFL